ncbi:hypothetical protein OH76DRAFT_1115400 [Lentinus brumalis]|uniref:Uncharacterized protein n=1 Tax=Lentinus brumalis TaxID=2498619 RepID=A0A371CV53_9APHY|nr:hypothetical protein OH76DRAFT_1115400 [Polyporus brumalis]
MEWTGRSLVSEIAQDRPTREHKYFGRLADRCRLVNLVSASVYKAPPTASHLLTLTGLLLLCATRPADARAPTVTGGLAGVHPSRRLGEHRPTG